MALAFPNTYWVGMSNLGFQTVYRLFNAEDDIVCSLRDENLRVLRAIDPQWDTERIRRDVVRGQYAAGWEGGAHVVGYRDQFVSDRTIPALKVPALGRTPQVAGLQARADLGGQLAGGIVEALTDLSRGLTADVGAGGDG